jgi:hypothetical protein
MSMWFAKCRGSRLADGIRIALRRRRRHIARDVQPLAVFVDRRLLQTAVERDRDRSHRRRHRDLVGAHEGLREAVDCSFNLGPTR